MRRQIPAGRIEILIDNGHGINTLGKRSPGEMLHEYIWNRLIATRTHLPGKRLRTDYADGALDLEADF